MALLSSHPRLGWLVVPETAAERALISHGLKNGGTLVLQEASFSVTQGAMLLPENLGPAACQRLLRAFEQASLTHQEACKRRQQFRLVRDG